MTALDTYKQYAAQVSATNEEIESLYAKRNGQIRELSALLADVLHERNYISALTWSLDSLDQSEIILRAAHDAAFDELKAFLSAKNNTYYDLMRSPDNDLVILELVYVTSPEEFFLKIHREFLLQALEKFNIANFNRTSIFNYLAEALVSAQYLQQLAIAAGVGTNDVPTPEPLAVDCQCDDACDCTADCDCGDDCECKEVRA